MRQWREEETRSRNLGSDRFSLTNSENCSFAFQSLDRRHDFSPRSPRVVAAARVNQSRQDPTAAAIDGSCANLTLRNIWTVPSGLREALGFGLQQTHFAGTYKLASPLPPGIKTNEDKYFENELDHERMAAVHRSRCRGPYDTMPHDFSNSPILSSGRENTTPLGALWVETSTSRDRP